MYDCIEGEGKVKYKSHLVFSMILLFVLSGCDRPKLNFNPAKAGPNVILRQAQEGVLNIL
jgi:hypothetical protein